MTRVLFASFILVALFACSGTAQSTAPTLPVPPEANPVPKDAAPKGEEQAPGQPGIIQDKHAFGVLPNYRTAEGDLPYSPITIRQKWAIATKDTVDGPSFALAGLFAGLGQLTDANPSFGQGFGGYLHRYGTGLADQDIGNYMTEAILPTALRQDPRYFRRGHGSFWGRVGWAASRVAVARNDSGGWTFNASEFLGNGITASIANAYYPDQVGFSPTMQRMFTQIGTDALSQVLKEFWPDVKRRWFHKAAGNAEVGQMDTDVAEGAQNIRVRRAAVTAAANARIRNQ
jgi:hypothetical protein